VREEGRKREREGDEGTWEERKGREVKEENVGSD
jgi:hypothetical protein